MNKSHSISEKTPRKVSWKSHVCGRFVVATAVLVSSQSLLPAQGQPKSEREIQAEKVLQTRSDTKNVLGGRIIKLENSAADLLVDDQSTPYTYDDLTVFEIDGKPGKSSDIPVGAKVEFFPDTSKDGRISRMRYRSPGAGRILTNDVDGELEVGVPKRLMRKTEASEAQPEDASPPGIGGEEGSEDAKVETDPIERADIGLELKTTTDGVLVVDVKKDKAAHQSGLEAGDIILKVGDSNLSTDKGVHREISKYSATAPVPLTIQRGEEKTEVSLTLPEDHKPKMETVARKPTQSPSPQQGLNKQNLGWKLTVVDEKIMIAEVEPISIVGASDAEEGDQILQVNGLVVSSILDVQSALNRSEFDQAAKLTLQRGPETMFVTLGDQSEIDTPGTTSQQGGTRSIMPRTNNSNQAGQSDVWDMINRQQAQIFQLQQEIQSLKAGMSAQR